MQTNHNILTSIKVKAGIHMPKSKPSQFLLNAGCGCILAMPSLNLTINAHCFCDLGEEWPLWSVLVTHDAWFTVEYS
jgi:hypothetical protein